MQLKGDSLRRQEELSRQYALEHDLELVEEFRLRDIGVSAFDGSNKKKGALSAFLKAVEKSEIPIGSYLLVESFDRISREKVSTALSTFLDIAHAGINIVTLSDKQIYSSDGLDLHKLLYSILIMSRANEESEIKSQRLSSAWEEKRKKIESKILTSICPSWLEVAENKTEFMLNPSKSSTVQEIFSRALAGEGAYVITRHLNENGIIPIGRSSSWGKSFVTKILKNRAVIGEFQPHKMVAGKRVPDGPPIPNYFPQVVDEKDFMNVQAIMKQRFTGARGRKGKKLANLFTNLAKCHYCGSSMHFVNKGKGPKGGYYLKCHGAMKGLDCSTISWKYDDFEATFLYFCREINLPQLLYSEKLELEKQSSAIRIGELTNDLDGKEYERNRVYDLLLKDEHNESYLREKLNLIGSEISLLNQQLKEQNRLSNEKQNNTEFVENNYTDLIALLKSSDYENYEKRLELRSLILKMVTSLTLAPSGSEPTDRKVKSLLYEHSKSAEDKVEIDNYYREIELLNKNASNPYFIVIFSDGSARQVIIDKKDPYKFEVKTEIGSDLTVFEYADGTKQTLYKKPVS